MKQIILLLTTLAFTVVTIAQPQNNGSNRDTATTLNRRLFVGNNPNSYQIPGHNNSGRFGYDADVWTNHQISNYTFMSELRKLKMQPNSYAKRVSAKQLINNYNLGASQVAAVCNTLRGYARLDVAQYAYTRCADPVNYDIVFNTLSTDMGNELADYINYTNSAYNQNENEQYNPYYYPAESNFRPMSAQLFASAKQTIENASFENTKLETAKTIISSNTVSTDQVVDICNLFSFEASKLAFAQFAYSHTYDQGNYFKVSNVFDFDASRVTLNRFIQNGGNN